jgi:type IV secretory pathway VirB4 component
MLILGSTGSGKTTLAALFNNEQLRAREDMGLFKIEFDS